MTTHATIAVDADVQGEDPRPGRDGVAGSATTRCGIAAPSAASLANNDPSACYPAAALALGATIKTDRRSIKADDFFQGMFTTALEQGELITSVEFPMPEKSAYEKFRNPASRYAIVGVFVAKSPAGVRVAITGAGQSGVFRHKEMEQALTANFSADAIQDITTPADGLNGDIHASAEYRAHLIGVMARRAWLGGLNMPGGGSAATRSSARSGDRSERVLAPLVLEACRSEPGKPQVARSHCGGWPAPRR